MSVRLDFFVANSNNTFNQFRDFEYVVEGDCVPRVDDYICYQYWRFRVNRVEWTFTYSGAAVVSIFLNNNETYKQELVKY